MHYPLQIACKRAQNIFDLDQQLSLQTEPLHIQGGQSTQRILDRLSLSKMALYLCDRVHTQVLTLPSTTNANHVDCLSQSVPTDTFSLQCTVTANFHTSFQVIFKTVFHYETHSNITSRYIVISSAHIKLTCFGYMKFQRRFTTASDKVYKRHYLKFLQQINNFLHRHQNTNMMHLLLFMQLSQQL